MTLLLVLLIPLCVFLPTAVMCFAFWYCCPLKIEKVREEPPVEHPYQQMQIVPSSSATTVPYGQMPPYGQPAQYGQPVMYTQPGMHTQDEFVY